MFSWPTVPARERVVRALREYRTSLGVRLITAGSGERLGLVSPGHLYQVLSGRVSLQVESDSGRVVSLLLCQKGEIFGEMQCVPRLCDPVNLGLRVAGLSVRRSAAASILEFPKCVTTELRAIPEFDARLGDLVLARLRDSVALLTLRALNEPGLTLAHLCLSPACGLNVVTHPVLKYLGKPIAIRKHVTLSEFERLSGFATNTVRHWLATLEGRRLIKTRRQRARGSDLSILEPELMTRALQERALTQILYPV